MDVATSQVEVGVRELKNQLSRYLERVQAGEDVIVTDRGRPVARLSSLAPAADRLSTLIADGVVRAPRARTRRRPVRRIEAADTVSDLVADQRR